MKLKLLFLLCLISLTGYSQNYRFLGSYDSDGVPDYLDVSDVVSQETLDTIHLALPEGFPVPDYNPQYISSGYDTDVILSEDAEVWVTFVGEGAGYQNVLGFYTYDTSQPRTSAPNTEEITIIFPNVSARGSGGGLEVGNKVKIGTFEAGTGIGWVLLANAWSNGSVGNGLWKLFSNPDFNPESDPSLRYHNVLLSDPDNERIILGFEDIRRDYGSCDNDFNDALFYVTANPFSAISAENIGLITDYTVVTSANDGGLESNGDLASLIAKRNFSRTQNASSINRKALQASYQKKAFKSSRTNASLYSYFPESGFQGTETSYISSPDDLLGITNASEVFSIDYYQSENRVSAALATVTKDRVYDHSKVICDRLNSSVLKDVRTINLKGHKIIYAKVKRAAGETEYALSFSVKDAGSTYELYSFWNIDKYPEGDYKNFQIWGSSMPQVCSITNHILSELALEKPFAKAADEQLIPDVFVSAGKYNNGFLQLNLINKSKAPYVNFTGNIRETEQSPEERLEFQVPLTGSYYEQVQVPVGYIFDIGFSMAPGNSKAYDALYLADGPWGVDFLETETRIDTFMINAHQDTIKNRKDHLLERSMALSGEVMGTVNVFRTLLPGHQFMDVSAFKSLSLYLQTDRPIEISIVTSATHVWEERFTYRLPQVSGKEEVVIPFEDFVSSSLRSMADIKMVVFSVQGDYKTFDPFTIQIDQLALTDRLVPEEIVREEETPVEKIVLPAKTSIYPNPVTSSATVVLPCITKDVVMNVFDLSGRQVRADVHSDIDSNTFSFAKDSLRPGIYVYTIVNLSGTLAKGKLIVQ
ncbi:DUF4114 domain-containing protein [Ascidiimonas aurantiaca]|uniref:DUF4114 domain-containing protein n=1 Tax=Ascidiimonas aurantiaca TaxID=1685432 RepID=UPI0030ECC61A